MAEAAGLGSRAGEAQASRFGRLPYVPGGANALLIQRPSNDRLGASTILVMQRACRLTLMIMVAAIAQSAVAAADAPVPVTTDTADYCAMLAAKIDQDTDASFDVIAMAAQGKSLCAKGNIRAGIARLRRALLAIRDEDGDDIMMPASPSVAPPTVVGSDDSSDSSGFFASRPPAANPPAAPPPPPPDSTPATPDFGPQPAADAHFAPPGPGPGGPHH